MQDILQLERATAAAAAHGRKHQPELQSLRGLAALIVVLHHCSFYYAYSPGLKTLAEIALNAHGAVVLFFVLSGYVLTKSLTGRPLGATQVIEFYVRRVFRIYPALWFSVLLAALYAWLFAGQPLPQTVETWWWPQARRMVPDDPQHYLLLLGGMQTTWALPLWTLKVEIIGSVLMPLVALAVLRAPALFAVTSVLVVGLLASGPEISGVVLYLSGFLLGAATLWAQPWLDRALRKDWQWLAVGLLGLALLLFGRNLMVADYRYNYFARPPFAPEAFGAAMVIATISVRPHLTPFLHRRPLVWLGDISYSLYLLHMPMIGLVAGLLDETLGLPPVGGNLVLHSAVLTAGVLALSVPLSALAYRYVELPGIRLGKLFHAGLSRSAGRMGDGWRARRLVRAGPDPQGIARLRS